MVGSGERKFLTYPTFNLVVEQQTINGEARFITQFANDFSTLSVIPFAELVKDIEGTLSGDLCMISSFLSENPLNGYEFAN